MLIINFDVDAVHIYDCKSAYYLLTLFIKLIVRISPSKYIKDDPIRIPELPSVKNPL
jgi:hypothetical protein